MWPIRARVILIALIALFLALGYADTYLAETMALSAAARTAMRAAVGLGAIAYAFLEYRLTAAKAKKNKPTDETPDGGTEKD